MARVIKKRARQYNLPIVIEPCQEGGFFGRCPVLTGCHVEAETIAEAIEFLEDAIKQYVISCREHGDSLPAEIEAYETDAACEEKLPVNFILPVRLAI